MAPALALRPLVDPLVEANDSLAAARAAGLRHVEDSQPGLLRRRTGKRLRQGKRWVEQFQILDAHGRVVRDREQLARIRRLAIPPAWQDVWICPHAAGHIQATGRDARGRKQYRYHTRWREHRDETKYAKMIAFARALPAVRRRVAADLRAPGLSRRKVLATVVRLLETTFIRVGNEEYARANRSFGLTTLKDRHVAFGPAEVRFHFRGKSGVFHEISIHDAAIARIVRRCRDLPGQELFQYRDESGQPATIDSADVNEYIRDIAGAEFTAKDFRTWAGTVLAATSLWAMGAGDASDNPRVTPDAQARPRRRPASKRDVVRAIEQVARRLGNTPSVCRKCYVHPEVIGAFLDGSLARDAAFAHALARAPAAALTTAGSLALPARSNRDLRPEEAAVLALLKRREAECSAWDPSRNSPAAIAACGRQGGTMTEALPPAPPDVLIVGAGPTGLLLALWLRRLGRRVRIVDKAAAPGTTSRALAVQARTLEQYRQLGVADQIVARGLKFAAVNLWAGGVQRGHVVLGDLGSELSPFPYVTTYPQDEHERLLVELLGREGVAVERRVELLGFIEEAGGVRAELRLADGATSSVTARYIAGCDGAHSAVRAALGEGFVGGTYDHLFYVADVRRTGR